MVNIERLVSIFMELARTDSPSFQEKKIAAIVTGHLNKLNLEYYEDDAKSKIDGDTGNIICTIKGKENLEPIAILAHMDTVTPCINKNPVIENRIIKTDGTTILGADDHAGVATILEVLYTLSENKIEHGDITVIFTVAEEKGLLGAKNLDLSKIHVKYAFVMDASGSIGTVTHQAPSQNSVKIVVRGLAAHAGVEPEKGINAIQVFASAITKMKLGRIDEETTANIGIINGGNATNIVCESVEAFGEVRSVDEEKLEKQILHMQACCETAAKEFDAQVEFTSKRIYSSYCVDKGHEILKRVEKATQNIQLPFLPVSSGGGSDTNVLNSAGITAVNLSVGMKKVHSIHETLDIDDLHKVAKLLVEIIRCES